MTHSESYESCLEGLPDLVKLGLQTPVTITEECATTIYRILHRKKYPSVLTDEPWALLALMIPPAKQSNQGGRPRTVNMREVLHTLFYLNRSGC